MTASPERSGPLQNRVTPFGEIVAVPERGTMMGNRGILHDARQHLRRRWAGRAWICCLLEFQGRRDPVMAPGHYTRLFFLDEPTALAAGHRPCAYCRRSAYRAFRDAWAIGNPQRRLGPTPRATEIDRVLHAERLGPGGDKRLHPTRLAGLPDGTFVAPYPTGHRPEGPVRASLDAEVWLLPAETTGRPTPDVSALLVWQGQYWRWSLGGYRPADPLHSDTGLLLTPPSIVAALAAGFRPEPPAFGPTHTL
jgi:hypothetical protein